MPRTCVSYFIYFMYQTCDPPKSEVAQYQVHVKMRKFTPQFRVTYVSKLSFLDLVGYLFLLFSLLIEEEIM